MALAGIKERAQSRASCTYLVSSVMCLMRVQRGSN